MAVSLFLEPKQLQYGAGIEDMTSYMPLSSFRISDLRPACVVADPVKRHVAGQCISLQGEFDWSLLSHCQQLDGSIHQSCLSAIERLHAVQRGCSASLRSSRSHARCGRMQARIVAQAAAQTLQKAKVPTELEDGELPLNTFSPKKPFSAKVKSVETITGPKATGETCHIIIETNGDIPFWEGQSYGIIPPVSCSCQASNNRVFNRLAS